MAFVNWTTLPERDNFRETFYQPPAEDQKSPERYEEKQKASWNAWCDPRETIYVDF
jgi:hypothetical protein